MPFRFRRSIRVAPGLRINLSKRGGSLTLGPRGEHVTLNSRGEVTQTLGLPGTGFSWQERKRVFGRRKQRAVQADMQCPECGEPCSSQWDECPKCGAPLHLELVE